MARPVKWSRDLHAIRERAAHSRTETYARADIERLFDVGRVSAQTLMKAIGEVQPIGSAHFIERSSLLEFLTTMIDAPSIDEALRQRLLDASPPPSTAPLKIALPSDLRSLTFNALPENIRVTQGRLEITSVTTVGLLESLATLAQVLQNDLAIYSSPSSPRLFPPRSRMRSCRLCYGACEKRMNSEFRRK
jgi:hypothetical protein